MHAKMHIVLLFTGIAAAVWRGVQRARSGRGGGHGAGKMHGDLSKSVKDTTLEHSLFAAFNTD